MPSVENGWVELTGDVEWDYQRSAAEKAIRGLTGVRGITNKIAIKAKVIQPSEIKEKIEEALTRAVSRCQQPEGCCLDERTGEH